MTVSDKLSKARTRLVLAQPFFGSLALRMPLMESDCNTMQTDGKAIYYSSEFVERLTPAELTGVLAHEVMHIALKHHTRRGEREASDWNMAGDYAINPLLIDSGFELPAGILLDDSYRDQSTDAIYNVIHREQPESESTGQGDSDGDSEGDAGAGAATDPGQCGGVMDYPAADAAELAAADAEATVNIMQAAAAAKAAGKMPGALERIINEIRKPSQSWREILRQWMDSSAKTDYAWTPPNKRYIQQGLYLPSMYSNELGEIIIAIDSSGSISQSDLAQFGAELKSIFAEVAPQRVHVIICGRFIRGVTSYGKGEFEMPEVQGGGGTDLRPPFQWAEDQGISPAGLIYFTDLAGPMPDDPGYPVLWVTESGNTGSGPFGQTLAL